MEIKEDRKTNIGMGHMIRAMQNYGFGHDEIMVMRKAMMAKNFINVNFCSDCYTDDWEDYNIKTKRQIPQE
jgi:hypothetical protein